MYGKIYVKGEINPVVNGTPTDLCDLCTAQDIYYNARRKECAHAQLGVVQNIIDDSERKKENESMA